jgi:putative redox protein
VDNQGDGSSFSPTDLVATALGSCMLTLMGITANRDGIDLIGARVTVEKHMSASPRRIGTLRVKLDMPAGIAASARAALKRAALACPVHRSLLPAIEIPVDFVYPD